MTHKTKKITIAGALYALFFAAPHAGIVKRADDNKCGGTERWEQKVLIDDAAENIHSHPKVTAIDVLDTINTSFVKIKMHTERQAIEEQVYTIKNCFISEAFREADDDIHLVIEDGHRHHMVAEIPDPKCSDAKHSEYIKDFRAARDTFLAHQDNYNHFRFNITAVLFIDKEHSKSPEGNNDNNVELHPVIKLQTTTKLPLY